MMIMMHHHLKSEFFVYEVYSFETMNKVFTNIICRTNITCVRVVTDVNCSDKNEDIDWWSVW